jgi:hypothetical protein
MLLYGPLSPEEAEDFKCPQPESATAETAPSVSGVQPSSATGTAASTGSSPESPCACAPAASTTGNGKPLTRATVDYDRFCESHLYRVIGPEKQPERRFSTLACAARTVLSSGPRFHVECGLFRASHAQCRQVVADADFARQFEDAREESKYWEKIKEPK